jgi:hypothetical protein
MRAVFAQSEDGIERNAMPLPEHRLGQLLDIGGFCVPHAIGISLRLSLKAPLTNMFRDRRCAHELITG